MRVPTYVTAVAAGVLAAACAWMQPQPASDAAAEPAPAAQPAPAATADVGSRVAPPFEGLHTLDLVIEKIREEEGLRLTAYQGPSGKWLIGYGHGGDDVTPGKTISAGEAEQLLMQDVRTVEDVIKSVVTVPINAAELSAMVDLAYNVGTGNFRESTVLRKLNEGDRQGAADAFMLWTKVRRNGELVVNPPLVERRTKERALFLGDLSAAS